MLPSARGTRSENTAKEDAAEQGAAKEDTAEADAAKEGAAEADAAEQAAAAEDLVPPVARNTGSWEMEVVQDGCEEGVQAPAAAPMSFERILAGVRE